VASDGGDGRELQERGRAAQRARRRGLLGHLVRPVPHGRAHPRPARRRVRRQGEGDQGRRGHQPGHRDALQHSLHPDRALLQGRQDRRPGRRRRPQEQVRRGAEEARV
ncbi:MAG: Thioredoxin, partial [uncultured Gemmatimonadaceae bacterium]